MSQHLLGATSLIDYVLFDPHHTGDVRLLSAKEAKPYFDWFVEQIPFRLAQLSVVTGAAMVDPTWLDLSAHSLARLGAWFGEHVRTVDLTGEEYERKLSEVPEWLRSRVPRWTFTIETVSLIADTGIYFAETMRRAYPCLNWRQVRSPKISADLNQPVLMGFPSSPRAELNPVRVVTVCADKIVAGASGAEVLTSMYNANAPKILET